ncbi:iron-containing redox enzyme family protein [Myxococcus xanthus]|uniref:iron-containing redox enzyme family protein n=1 Tax=Myxococcus xanthus TaxID=34 RepID=UPI0019175B38|nr:iron-containing redox enzyme family protein [Myxococcus xanthus]QQR41757.1 iron-containing redox enzyme family protein [Myxococcus xanthus]
MATNRSRLTEILGALLATETMIPGRFEWQIQGWRRLGVGDKPLEYLLEHTTVDVEHANDSHAYVWHQAFWGHDARHCLAVLPRSGRDRLLM